VSRPVSLPRAPHAAGSLAEPAAPVWLEWTCLSIIYVVWGSTYLAIRVMVETIPPLLGAGLRFVLAGGLLVGFLVVRRGWAAVRPTNRQLAGCLAMGILLPGANAVVTVAEVDVPSGLAALLIAAVPLILIVMRRASGEKITRTSTIGVAIGFMGVAILLLPGEKPDGASIAGMLALIGAAAMWASGSFFSAKTDLPKDPFASTGWQMLLGGGAITLAGLLAGEAGDVHASEWSTRSVAGFVYLVLIGSLIAYSAYVWLLQNAPVSKVATYAYVNPVIAIFLGWIVLSETVTATTLIGAGVIVASVAAVVSAESR
jgi:drug/metabolite transporter (DMT)-like permease